ALLKSGQSILAKRKRERGLRLTFRGLALASVMSLAVVLPTHVRNGSLELLQMRESSIRSLARVLADHLTASLAFDNEEDAAVTLDSLRLAEPPLKAAVFDVDRKIFAAYPRSFTNDAGEYLTVRDGYHQDGRKIIFVTVVLEAGKRLGTLVL